MTRHIEWCPIHLWAPADDDCICLDCGLSHEDVTSEPPTAANTRLGPESA